MFLRFICLGWMTGKHLTPEVSGFPHMHDCIILHCLKTTFYSSLHPSMDGHMIVKWVLASLPFYRGGNGVFERSSWGPEAPKLTK